MNTSLGKDVLDQVSTGQCQLIDVREPVEFAEEHVPGAVNIPLGEITRRAGEIEKSRSVVVMCLAGKRGEQAREKLSALGFNDVQNLEGGINAWKQAGLDVVRGQREALPLMRQVQIVIGVFVLTGSVLALTVNPLFALIPAFFGGGLIFAGSTGWCGLAILMSKMPWNRVGSKSCCS
jgi:rhodanese-related sulfurtransferase